ncbi:hypothetical protein TevJSym_an00280 [endosymbiont of Tevnia jerichonana (vent Tica)]|uniref:Uncharacterized protein n=1 Tax=endosymbiont of Tevnia jerichonana (vent Tica) TaxID=1049564 RepID=G2FFR9_9GAMM|nr:hypothetical protein TevJSym_an00280 [endosymbiont of Tevnia jerichonana (vent Tica)]
MQEQPEPRRGARSSVATGKALDGQIGNSEAGTDRGLHLENPSLSKEVTDRSEQLRARLQHC